MVRAVWTGSLSFGLVSIPVRLFPATEPKDVRFHLMDARGRRVRYRRVVEGEEPEVAESAITPSAPEGARWSAPESIARPTEAWPTASDAPPPADRGRTTEVAFEDLMRGYETDHGVVLFGREELEAVRPERSRSIEIEDFVDLADIDPIFFEKSYYLAPREEADKPYALLLRAMERAGRVGIGRFVLRTKPHLVAIRPADGVLALQTLFFGDEVRDGRRLAPGIEAVETPERELRLAEQLIETLAAVWDPAAYADEYREELLRRIREKATVEPPDEEAAAGVPSAGVAQLMEALRESVQAARRERESSGPTPARKRSPRAKPASKTKRAVKAKAKATTKTKASARRRSA